MKASPVHSPSLCNRKWLSQSKTDSRGKGAAAGLRRGMLTEAEPNLHFRNHFQLHVIDSICLGPRPRDPIPARCRYMKYLVLNYNQIVSDFGAIAAPAATRVFIRVSVILSRTRGGTPTDFNSVS
jgi:hypothetical protein